MAAVLLDVNVLVALFSEDHSYHVAAQKWFREHEKKGWATCPFTQAGFVRLLSNPFVAKNAVPPTEAIAVLDENTSTPHHEFWADDISYAKAIEPLSSKLSGHRQVTDAYLLGLAMHRKGKLATFDLSIAALLPEGKRKSDWIVELSA
jgi:uncharacterized protein